MKQSNQWTGTRSVPIKEFTNTELNDTIKRTTNRRNEMVEKNDSLLDNVIRIFDDLLAQLVAERTERIGK